MTQLRIRQRHLIPQKMMAAIGDVTISFAALQYNVELVIGFFLDGLPQEKQRAVTAGHNFAELLRLLDSLYVHHEPKLMPHEEFRKIMVEVEQAANQRNKLNHSMMYLLNDKLYTFAFDKKKPGRGAQIVEKYLTTPDIEAIAEQIQIASGTLHHVFHELHRHRGKRPSQCGRPASQ